MNCKRRGLRKKDKHCLPTLRAWGGGVVEDSKTTIYLRLMCYIFRNVTTLPTPYPHKGPLQDISGSLIMGAALTYRTSKSATVAGTACFQLGCPIPSLRIVCKRGHEKKQFAKVNLTSLTLNPTCPLRYLCHPAPHSYVLLH